MYFIIFKQRKRFLPSKMIYCDSKASASFSLNEIACIFINNKPPKEVSTCTHLCYRFTTKSKHSRQLQSLMERFRVMLSKIIYLI